VPGATIGWYGKLPSHGDFLQRRAPDGFISIWDAWLQECLAHSRAELGSKWLQTYLTSPVWRFFLSDGLIGASSCAGLLLPSVDRVGRYFPLTIFAVLPADLPPMAVAIHGREWLETVEELALAALESEDFNIEVFDASLLASAEALGRIEQYYGLDLGEAFPGSARDWRVPMASADRMAASLIDPLIHSLARQLRPLTAWWTDGSERVSASCLLCQAMPSPERFVALLDGDWEAAGWSGEFGDLHSETREEVRYRIEFAAASETGPVRAMNQDRTLGRPEAGIWAVADGMGGHSRGEYASQLTVDVLAAMEPAATLGAVLESVRTGVERANDDLQRAALRVSQDERSGCTIVVLCIRQHEWGVLWAGDSRAYLLRQQRLKALTRDHTTEAELAEDFDDAAPPPSCGEITRAVGGHETLLLDRITGHVRLHDRLLLCSDGLHGALAHEAIAAIMRDVEGAQAAVDRLLKAAIEAGTRDNVSVVIIDILPETQADG
jgi:type VI secretion system protein ImpM